MFARAELEGEVRCDAHAREIGIAVAQRRQRHARGQARQRRQGVGIELDAVAFGEEDLECDFGLGRVIAGLAHRPLQRDQPHRAEVVDQVGMFGVHLIAQIAHPGSREPLRGAGAVRRQPVVQHLLDPHPDRRERPQRVVEVESDGADLDGIALKRHSQIIPRRCSSPAM